MKLLLKRRLNPFLLLTTIAGLALLAGVSILYQTQLEEVNEDKSNLNSTIEELRTENAQLTENNTRITIRINNLEEELANATSKNSELTSEKQGLESDIDDLNNRIGALEGDLQNVCDELANASQTEECDDYT